MVQTSMVNPTLIIMDQPAVERVAINGTLEGECREMIMSSIMREMDPLSPMTEDFDVQILTAIFTVPVAYVF